MDEPDPKYMMSDAELTKLIGNMVREEGQTMAAETESWEKYVSAMDRILFALEAAGSAAEMLPDMAVQLAEESGILTDAVLAICAHPDGRTTDMLHAVRLCLALAYRFVDAAHRGFKKLADPLSDKSNPTEV